MGHKTILLLTTSYALSDTDSVGAGTFVRQFAFNCAQRENLNIIILTPYKGAGFEENLGVKQIFFPWIGKNKGLTNLKFWNLLHALKLLSLVLSSLYFTIKICRQEKVDSILAFWVIPSGLQALLAKKILKIPYVTWALGSDIWNAHKYPLGKFLVKKILANATANYADGIELAGRVNTEFSQKNTPECNFLASNRKLALPKASPKRSQEHFLFVGRYHPNKGADILLEAFLEVHKKFPKAKLSLYGGGHLESLLKSKIEKFHAQEYISLNGYIEPEELAQDLTNKTCLIIPSRIESIPLIFSEGLQAKIPIIITDTGDLGDLGRKYNLPYIAKAGNVKSLIEQISTFLIKKDFTPDKNIYDIFDLESSIDKYIECITKH
jgi:glycosyltransferase involved in cell wall biosynthesis